MHIAIIHHQYAKKGGMETYLFDLIKGFSAYGDTVTVITYRADPALVKASSASCYVEKKTIWLPGVWRKFYFMHYINKSFVRSEYDLTLSLMRTASQTAVVCGGTHLGYLDYLHKKPKLKDKIETYFERKSYAESPYIIAHSSMLRDELIELYKVASEKIKLFYPPVNTAVFNYALREKRNIYRQNFALKDDKITLLFPSTGHQRKGWGELAQAMRLLPQDRFELIVVGSKIEGCEQQSNVRALGFVHNMAELYAAVDFTILPSHYEPYGLVVAESLQCGTPVIVSSMVGAKDFVTNDSGVIIPAITPKAIAQAILQAADQRFVMIENFAMQHGLTLEQHIAYLRELGVGPNN